MSAPAKLEWKDLVIDSRVVENDALLSPYSWMFRPEDYAVEVVTTLGDCFLRKIEDGTVHWLDTAEGMLQKVADDISIFKDKLSITGNQMNWFLPHLIDGAKQLGLSRQSGELYAYRDHPRVGGNFKAINLTTRKIAEHFSYTGELHLKMKDVPPGEIL